MPAAIVTSQTPITLHGGRPAGPGEEVEADVEHDRDHFDTGALTLVDAPDVDDLEALTREDLNARARELGVEDPEKFQNKAAVIAAIPAATTED